MSPVHAPPVPVLPAGYEPKGLQAFFAGLLAAGRPIPVTLPAQAPRDRHWPAGKFLHPLNDGAIVRRHPALAEEFPDLPEARVGRVPVSRPNGGRRGEMASLKGLRDVRASSTLEMGNLIRNELDPDVARFVEQPFTIRLKDGPRRRSYTPDLLVFHQSGLLEVQEVKPEEFAVEDEASWALLGETLASMGFAYRVVTDAMLAAEPRASNEARIWGDRQAPIPVASERERIAALLRSAGPSTVSAVLDAVPGMGVRNLHALVRRGFLEYVAPHTRALDGESEVRLGRGLMSWLGRAGNRS